MKTNTIICGLVYAGFGWLAACSNEEKPEPEGMPGDAVSFVATLQTVRQANTKAVFDDEKGTVEVLPYVNNISIRKVQPSAVPLTVTPYNVKSANKGVLEYNGTAADALKWDKDRLDEPVDFFAWTTPSGVQIDTDANEGTIDFKAGNTYAASPTDVDKLNGAAVTPLEVLISAASQGNDYHVSPSVTLPFTHLVSKVSLYLRNWDAQHIDPSAATDASIEFFSIPQQWKVAQTTAGSGKAPFRVTEAVAGSVDLKLDFTDLHYDASNGYFTFYLPPLTAELGTDFITAGDFCITYGAGQDKYYGTLASISVTDPKFTELHAGQHIALQLDLSKNYGVGVGCTVVNWQGPAKEETLYANPNKGIYSVEGLRCLAEYLNSTEPAKQLADSLYVTDGGKTIIRLYTDLTVRAADASSVLGASLEGIVFDGQGHTVTLPGGASGLFNRIGASAPGISTEIKNLYLKGGALTARGMLADEAGNVVITNCHALAGSIAPATGAAGGLIGTAGAGTEMHFCSSVIAVTGTEAAGGLAGTLSGAGASPSLDGCYAQGIITGNGTSAGGLIGDMQAGALTNCFFYSDGTKGHVTGTATNKGAIAGEAATGVTISQCYWGDGAGLPVTGGTRPSLTKCSSFTIDGNTLASPVTINAHRCKTLMEALRAGTSASGMEWVRVYGKDYPVVKKE